MRSLKRFDGLVAQYTGVAARLAMGMEVDREEVVSLLNKLQGELDECLRSLQK